MGCHLARNEVNHWGVGEAYDLRRIDLIDWVRREGVYVQLPATAKESERTEQDIQKQIWDTQAHLVPKVMVPYVTRPGATPREVEMQR